MKYPAWLLIKELKSMLAYLLVRVECHQYHLTSQQGPAFDRLQGCSQVNNLLSLIIVFIVTTVHLKYLVFA